MVVFENSVQVELQQTVDKVTALSILGKNQITEAFSILTLKGKPMRHSKQDECHRVSLK